MNTEQILNSFSKLVKAIDNRINTTLEFVFDVYCEIPKKAIKALIASKHPKCIELKETYMAIFLIMYKQFGYKSGSVTDDFKRYTFQPKLKEHRPDQWWIILKSHSVDITCFTASMITELRLYLNKTGVTYPIYDWVERESENINHMLNIMLLKFLSNECMVMTYYNNDDFEDIFDICEECLDKSFPYFRPKCKMPACCFCKCINPHYEEFDKDEELDEDVCTCKIGYISDEDEE